MGIFMVQVWRGIHHFHLHPTIGTQSTPNYRGVWKWNLAVAQRIGENIDVSPTDMGQPMPEEIRDSFQEP